MARRRAPRGLSIALVFAAAGCAAQPVLVLVNRSGRDIAFYPGVVVGSCGTVSLTQDQLHEAQGEFERWFTEEEQFGWVPPGALRYEGSVPAVQIGSPDPLSVVISSIAEPRWNVGFVPADLPECGGEPVGVSPLPAG